MDLAREFAKELGVEVEFVPMQWTSLPTALATDEIDMIIAGMTATEKRRATRTFSDPYFHTHLCLLVNADAGIEGRDDLAGKRIVVKQGTTGDIHAEEVLQEDFPDIEITKLQDEGSCVLDVVSGRADAFVFDQLSVWRHYQEQPNKTRAILDPLTSEPYAIAVQKGDTKFANRINEFLETIREDGRYDAIFEKYEDALPPKERAKTKKNKKREAPASMLDEVLERGTLVVGTVPEFKPFMWRDRKGAFRGIDADLARAFAEALGVEVEFRPMEWNDLPGALVKGRIDMIAAGMTITDERRGTRSFSDPYFHTGLALLVRKEAGIDSAKDVRDRRLVVKQGTTGQVAAGRLFPDAAVTKRKTEAECVADLLEGRADAFLYDQLTVQAYHEEHPEKTRALLEPLTSEPYGFAVAKGDERFVKRINGFLAKIRESGRYEEILAAHDATMPKRD